MGLFKIPTFAEFKKRLKEISSPIDFFKSTRTSSKIIAGTIAGALIYPPAIVPTIRSIIPKSIPGKIAGFVAAPLVVGIIAEKPKETEKVLDFLVSPEKSKERFNLGRDIAKGDRVKIKEAVKTAGLVGGGAVLVGGIIKAVPKIKDKIKDIIPSKDGIISQPVPVSIPVPSVEETPSLPEIPISQPGELNSGLLPETIDITTKKRKKYKRRKPVSPIRITNKNYLSVENFC